MKSSYPSPEAWRAQVLADEITVLQIATRSLEFQLGFHHGLQTGRWQSAQDPIDAPMAPDEAAAGQRRLAAGAADPGTRS